MNVPVGEPSAAAASPRQLPAARLWQASGFHGGPPPQRGLLGEMAAIVRGEGALALPRLALRWLLLPRWRRRPAVRQGFVFRGHRYPYAAARYRLTWTNERAVELPLAIAELEARRGGRVLEVGNVLRHYGRRGHSVVDKYERAPGVVNLDVLDVPGGYDLVFSVSTLEHVGWDETPREPAKAAAAVRHLQSCLNPGGRLWLSIPLGYHRPMEEQIATGELDFTSLGCLVRTGPLAWQEIVWEGPGSHAYGSPFRCANAVLIAVHEAAPRRLPEARTPP